MNEQNGWQKFLDASRVKPPFYLGGIHNFLIRNSIASPLELAFSPHFFDVVTRGVLYVSRDQYVWSFDSCGVTKNLKQRPVWDQPILLQGLLQLDVDLRSEEKPLVFHQARRILWGTFCNLLFADTSFIVLQVDKTFLSQRYAKGVPDGKVLLSDVQKSSSGLVFGAKLSKDWFQELPFDLLEIEQSIPRQLARKVNVVWQDDLDVSSFTAVA